VGHVDGVRVGSLVAKDRLNMSLSDPGPASPAPASPTSGEDAPFLDLTRSGVPGPTRLKERVIESLLLIAGVSSVIITIGIVLVLLTETVPFFGRHVEKVALSGLHSDGPFTVTAINKRPGDEVRKKDVLLEVSGADGKAIPIITHYDGVVRRIDAEVGQTLDLSRFTVADENKELSEVESSEAAAARAEPTTTPAETRREPIAQVTWRVGFLDFFGDTIWTPAFADKRFGIWALIAGTMVTTVVAIFVAVPVGTITAIWLSEYCKANVREVIKPILELLSAVPTVVYGYFALLAITPILQSLLGGLGLELPSFNMLSAGLVMGVMIIPYVASLSEDAMRQVPMALREGSYAMGATRVQTATRVILPAAFSGVTAAYILGIARAVGETMIVAIAAGQMPTFTADPTDSGQTLTAFIVGISKGDTPRGSLEYRTIYVCGLVLLVMTLFFNVAGYLIRKRYREAY
jgi:phosphate transport system permease protein